MGSLSPLPHKDKTLVGQISEDMNSEEEKEEQSEASIKKSRAEWRNWAGLPRDILLIIFKKIAAAAILSSAQFVCRPWRHLSHEPELWRCIDMRMHGSLNDKVMVYLAMMAVDRSEGCVEEFYLGDCRADELLYYISERATRLLRLRLISVRMDEETSLRLISVRMDEETSLRLISGSMNEDTLAQTLRKLPLLEELQISHCRCFSYKVVERIGPSCPQLKSFRLDDEMDTFQFYRRSDFHRNVAALAIAKHFKQLRRLQLFANCLTSIGLSAILDNCPDLEYLDIRCCFNVGSLDESLKNKCARIKDFRLPNDSVVDYEYLVDEFEASDFHPHLSDTDSDSSGCSYDGGISFDRYRFSDFSSYHDYFI